MSGSSSDSNIEIKDIKNTNELIENKKKKQTTYLKSRLLYLFDKNIPLEKYEYTNKLSCHLFSSNQ
jgi:hypothetical protein